MSSPGQSTSSIDLVWTPPVNSGGAPTTGYIVYRNDGLGGTDFSTVGYDGTGSTELNATIRDLVGGSMYEFREILKTGFESIETFVRLSAYWHHFCMPQFNSRNVKWLCHFPDMWWCAATGPIVHRGRDELAREEAQAVRQVLDDDGADRRVGPDDVGQGRLEVRLGPPPDGGRAVRERRAR